MKPNLFNFATSELSQDAFLCWILAYADNKYANNPLCIVGKQIIEDILKASSNISINNITTVEVYKQLEYIDICVLVNSVYLIVIESKVNSNPHSNQLQRYKNSAVKSFGGQGKNIVIVPVYIKTGNDSQLRKFDVRMQGYWYCSRGFLLNYKNLRAGKSDIFDDFMQHLQAMEDDTCSFQKKLIQNWSWRAWEGFYMHLEQNVCKGWQHMDWHYVANPRGGFWVFYAMFASYNSGLPYLQIEQGQLVIKIGNIKDNRSQKRTDCFNLLMAEAQLLGLNNLRPPNRFGNGVTMTLAVVDRENWLGMDNTVVALPTVIKEIAKYEELIKNTITTMKSHIAQGLLQLP